MDDLIERDWVLKRMVFEPDYEVVQMAPAVDAEPVRHAVWDNSGRYRFKNGRIAIRCTSCGCALTKADYRNFRWDYCPVCGAKMDGGSDDENA